MGQGGRVVITEMYHHVAVMMYSSNTADDVDHNHPHPHHDDNNNNNTSGELGSRLPARMVGCWGFVWVVLMVPRAERSAYRNYQRNHNFVG